MLNQRVVRVGLRLGSHFSRVISTPILVQTNARPDTRPGVFVYLKDELKTQWRLAGFARAASGDGA